MIPRNFIFFFNSPALSFSTKTNGSCPAYYRSLLFSLKHENPRQGLLSIIALGKGQKILKLVIKSVCFQSVDWRRFLISIHPWKIKNISA